MSNEQLFFGLSQVLRKFPKETGKKKQEQEDRRMCYFSVCSLAYSQTQISNNKIDHSFDVYVSDRVLCHFCFKPKVTNKVLAGGGARKSQIIISSIILLKTALDALPLLSTVNSTTLIDVQSPALSDHSVQPN